MQRLSRTSWLALGAVLVSLAVTFLRTPLLNGAFGGLVVTVLLQFYLPGWLLARALGKQETPHPIVRFAWVLTCGLGLTITLGAAARLFNIPIPVYLLALHSVMLLLALLPLALRERRPEGEGSYVPWTLRRAALPLYGLVLVCCLVAFGVGYESRNRFWGFEDQPIFISLIDWLAYHPDTLPNDLPLRSRQIGVLNGDSRMDTDGWSYNHAAWVWASGVPAVQLIWYDLGTLFLWAIPLLMFALAYVVIGRESAAAWSAAALTLVGLMTADNVVFHPDYTAYGRFVLFQINTLRQASLAIMLPLALMAGLSYLKGFQRRDLIIVALAGVALAAMHPITTMIFVFSMGATMLLKWLAAPGWGSLPRLLPLALVLGALLALPFIQRLNRSGLGVTSTLVRQSALEDESIVTTGYFRILRDLPLLGDTYIREPASVFYTPTITLAFGLGLVYGLWWRRSLAAQYLFGATALALLLFFTPGLTECVDQVASSVGVLTLMLLLPVALLWGLSLDHALAFLERGRSGQRSAVSGQLVGTRYIMPLISAVFMLAFGVLLFEPLPIAASARDQLRAFNDMQAIRRMRPSQEAVIASLKARLTPGEISVWMTPYDLSNLVIEDIPDTLITGGRRNRNTAIEGTWRFYNDSAIPAPWLDSADLEFMRQFGVTHLIVTADSTRLPQLLLQPERFELLDAPAGCLIFRLLPEIQADAEDELFARMNTLYSETQQPRWGKNGFNLIRPGDAGKWQAVAEEWAKRLDDEPENDRARLGLAFAWLMMGADDGTLPLWEALQGRHPEVFLYTDALASTLQIVRPDDNPIAPLLDALDGSDATSALAARRLLTETFFYRLDSERLTRVLAVTEAHPLAWDRLAALDQPDTVRRRAGLLMHGGQWAKAREWLDAIPRVEHAPQDVMAMAACALALGDVEGALALLQPTTDADWVRANAQVHGDRWEENTTARLYELLRSPQEGGFANPSRQAGEMLSPLLMAQTGAVSVMSPEVTRGDERRLTVEAIYGNFQPFRAYPAQRWNIQIISPDSATKYAEVEVPAEIAPGALQRHSIEVLLPDDLEPLTPALVYIQPRYNNAVASMPAILPIVLNRPESAEIPADATLANLPFGEQITLQSYSVEREGDALNVTLYWRASEPPAADYQVFVHVVDTAGEKATQRDSAPLDNRYPTSQWRTGVTIADTHRLTLGDLPPGEYGVWIGLYRLSDFARLPILSDDQPAPDDSLNLFSFSQP